MEYLSQEKFEELQKELEQLKTIRRKEVAEQLEFAKSLGDLSENAEYHEARDEQARVEDRIAKLENVLKSSTIVSSTEHKKGVVGIGSYVTLKKEGSDKQKFLIVGSEESDISSAKISINSPIGSAVLSKKKGDKVSVSTPKGNLKYEIISVD